MIKQKLKKTQKKYLSELFRKSTINYQYKKAIDIFEEYQKKYALPEKLMLNLAHLYDHLAQQAIIQNKSSPMINQYEEKALKIYKTILRKDSKSYKALYGIGHIFRNRKKLKIAIYYHLKAYHLDKNKRSTAAIGLLYELIGNTKKAEYWYKKELQDKGKNDFGANVNLVFFYNRQNYAKAYIYAERAAKYFKKQPSSFKNSKWGKIIKKEIEKLNGFQKNGSA